MTLYSNNKELSATGTLESENYTGTNMIEYSILICSGSHVGKGGSMVADTDDDNSNNPPKRNKAWSFSNMWGGGN